MKMKAKVNVKSKADGVTSSPGVAKNQQVVVVGKVMVPDKGNKPVPSGPRALSVDEWLAVSSLMKLGKGILNGGRKEVQVVECIDIKPLPTPSPQISGGAEEAMEQKPDVPKKKRANKQQGKRTYQKKKKIEVPQQAQKIEEDLPAHIQVIRMRQGLPNPVFPEFDFGNFGGLYFGVQDLTFNFVSSKPKAK